MKLLFNVMGIISLFLLIIVFIIKLRKLLKDDVKVVYDFNNAINNLDKEKLYCCFNNKLKLFVVDNNYMMIIRSVDYWEGFIGEDKEAFTVFEVNVKK